MVILQRTLSALCSSFFLHIRNSLVFPQFSGHIKTEAPRHRESSSALYITFIERKHSFSAIREKNKSFWLQNRIQLLRIQIALSWHYYC